MVYQKTVRPRLGDILRLPLWLVNLVSPRPASSTLDAFHRSVDELITSRTQASVDGSIDLLRRPPAHTLAREAIRSDLILGHTVPAGSAVIISPWLRHRKASLWPELAEFKPERFSPASSRTRQRFAYIPFGAGPRICIGAAFALEEAMLILATVAQRYALRLKPGHPVEPLGLITLQPRYGMKMLLGRRASPHSP
jgi:Cytochrome P450